MNTPKHLDPDLAMLIATREVYAAKLLHPLTLGQQRGIAAVLANLDRAIAVIKEANGSPCPQVSPEGQDFILEIDHRGNWHRLTAVQVKRLRDSILTFFP